MRQATRTVGQALDDLLRHHAIQHGKPFNIEMVCLLSEPDAQAHRLPTKHSFGLSGQSKLLDIPVEKCNLSFAKSK